MRVSPGRLITAAACCAALAAVPASIAQATSPKAARHATSPKAVLSIDVGHSSSHHPAHRLTAPVRRFFSHPARPVLAHAHAHAERTAGLTGRVTAHTAGDPAVTIADFHFSPASTTIHVGDTITWSNSGPSSHTATASNGSFNTGILKKGQSASHTFTQPGTYAYVCQIHPFMHGTITVLASTTSTTTSSTTPAATTTGAATTTPTATTAAAQTGPSLPNTGFNVLAGLFAGLVLLGLGAGLRRTRSR
jgi:LPXTG-motif cell wall-anchored protein